MRARTIARRSGAGMARIKQIGGVAIIVLFFVVVFDVAGVAVSFVLDVLSPRRDSLLARYAIWFVLGVFCGVICYGAGAGDERKQHAPGALVLATIVGVVALILAACTRLLWQTITVADSYVPDSVPLTITFAVALIGGAAVLHGASRPRPTAESGGGTGSHPRHGAGRR